jgi:hypothetical protein
MAERVRSTIRPMKFSGLAKALNPLANRFGFYTAYQLSTKEFIGIAKWDGLATRLEEIGYEPPPRIGCIPLSAAKTHPVTGATHNLTMRKLDPQDNTRQYHVHAFRMDTVAAIASHYELRPDLMRLPEESSQERKERLETHYRPIWGEDYLRGEKCEDIQQVLRC